MPLRDATADDDRLRALLPRLWCFARSLAGDPAAADDLVQSALERALRGWDARRDDQALQAWLSVSGVDIATIGFLSLVGLPYTFKFLWAPLMDRFDLPWLGRRRG